MALASLFARSRESSPVNIHKLPVHAFIVDHKVRAGSTEEAEWVAEQCRIKCKWLLGLVSHANHADMK